MYDSKILIVENDYIVAEDLQQILEKMGYDILGITATGQDAITKTGETNPESDFDGYNAKWEYGWNSSSPADT